MVRNEAEVRPVSCQCDRKWTEQEMKETGQEVDSIYFVGLSGWVVLKYSNLNIYSRGLIKFFEVVVASRCEAFCCNEADSCLNGMLDS